MRHESHAAPWPSRTNARCQPQRDVLNRERSSDRVEDDQGAVPWEGQATNLVPQN